MTVDEDAEISLRWPDYLVIGAVLAFATSIGIYYRFSGGRQKTAEEYFSANRGMSVPLLAVALMVAFVSAISVLGNSGENYIYGAQLVAINLGFIIATPIAAFLYLPVFYNLQNMSVYEYLNRRFGATARFSASLTNFFQMGLYTGVVLYAPALALEATIGLSSTASVLLIGLICTFYSSIGGIKAVLATDVFQGALMFATVICVIGIGCYDVDGGFSGVWRIAREGGRLNLSNFDPDPTVRHTWWTLTTGGLSYFLLNFAVSQIHVQRLLSARSLKSAQLSLFLNTPMIILMVFATSFAGLVLYAWFEGCDPVVAGRIASFDQVMPYFAKVRLSQIPGLMGFFIAGIFSAALSTVSAMLNSLSAVAIADYVKPIYRKFGWNYRDSKTATIAKIVCVVNGLFCVGIALLASGFGSLMQTAYAMNGAIGGPLLGLFSLGMFVESANEIGAVVGTVMSLGLSIWMSFGRPRPPVSELPVSIELCSNSSLVDNSFYRKLDDSSNADEADYFYLYRISYMLYTPLGMATTLLFGYIASTVVRCFTKNPIREPDPDLFTPFVAARIKRRRRVSAKPAVSQVFVLSSNQSVSEETVH